MTSAVDLSAVALAKLHSRSRPVTSGNEADVNEPGFHRSAQGTALRATWAAGPERRFFSAIPAGRGPSFESPRTPRVVS